MTATAVWPAGAGPQAAAAGDWGRANTAPEAGAAPAAGATALQATRIPNTAAVARQMFRTPLRRRDGPS